MRKLLLALLFLSFSGCTWQEQYVYLIPAGYEGWVNIIFCDGEAPHSLIRPARSDTRICFVAAPSSLFLVGDAWRGSKAWNRIQVERLYYFYSSHGIAPFSPGQIHDLHLTGWIPGNDRRQAYSFYVTRKALTDEEALKYTYPVNQALFDFIEQQTGSGLNFGRQR